MPRCLGLIWMSASLLSVTTGSLWRQGCLAASDCDSEPCASELFIRASELAPEAKLYPMSTVLAFAAEKRWEEAEVAFQKAVGINRQYTLPYFEARSLLEWAEMYLLRDQTGDREHGMGLLDQALAIFQRVQASKMVERVLSSKEVLNA